MATRRTLLGCLWHHCAAIRAGFGLQVFRIGHGYKDKRLRLKSTSLIYSGTGFTKTPSTKPATYRSTSISNLAGSSTCVCSRRQYISNESKKTPSTSEIGLYSFVIAPDFNNNIAILY